MQLHDPYAVATPSMRLAAAERNKRFAKIAASAKRECVAVADPVEEIAPEKSRQQIFAEWVERQKLIPLPHSPSHVAPTVRAIQLASARHFNVTFAQILAHERAHHITLARHVGMYLAHELCKYSTIKIGRFFGGRDHTTAIHAIRRIAKLIGTDPRIPQDISAIKTLLGVA